MKNDRLGNMWGCGRFYAQQYMHKRISIAVFSIGCLLCSMTGAQSTPSSPSAPVLQRATILTKSDSKSPYFQLDLPTSIYSGSLHPDLHDVRLRNADGDLLPYAWLDADVETAKLESKTVAQFPLYDLESKTDSNTGNGVITGFRQNPDGSLTPLGKLRLEKQNLLTGWIFDLSQIKGQLLQAKFGIAEQVNGIYKFSLQSSDDLKNWQTLSDNEQLVQLRHAGATVQSLNIKLNYLSTKYLRLRWNNPAQAPLIETLSVDSQQQVYVPSALQWSKAIKAKACSNDYCDYSLPRNTPVDSLRLLLSENNTLAQVTVLGQLPAEKTVANYRHSHNPFYPLHVLRHQKQQAQTQADRFVSLDQPLLYRIRQPDGEAVSPDLPMNGASYLGLRLQSIGPITMLGKIPPEIQIASLPRRLVFLARGKAPYQLEWGRGNKDGMAVNIHTLMPQADLHKPLQADIANVEIADYIAPAPVQAATSPAAKEHKHWLWAALAAGIVLLAAMVWSLLKNMSSEADKKSE